MAANFDVQAYARLAPRDVFLTPQSLAKNRAVALPCRGVSGTDEAGGPLCKNGMLPDLHSDKDKGAIPSGRSQCDYASFPFDAPCH